MPSQFHFIQAAKPTRLRSVLPAALLAFGLLGATTCGSFAITPPPPGTTAPPSPPTPPPPPPPPTVVVMPGIATGGDLGDNDTVSDGSQCSAVVNNPPVTDDEVSVDGPHWSWSSNGSYLDDGTQDPDPSASGTAIFALSPHSPDSDSTCDYTVTFDNPGDYVLTLTATATYKETILQGPDKGKVTTVSFSGDGNPGMDDPDAPAPTSTPSALQPNAGASASPNAPAPQPKAPPKIASVPGGSKGLYITSSLGATFYKDGNGVRQQNPTTDPNHPWGINPLKIDTVGSSGNKTITYNGFVHGHWGSNSPYTWTSGVVVGSGLFKPNPINAQPVTYYPATFGSTSSVALHMTDSHGGKAAPDGVGNVTFHKPVNLVQNPSKIIPLPDKPTPTSLGDWGVLTTHVNNSNFEEGEELKYSQEASYDYKASFDAEGKLGVDAKLFDAELKLTIGFDITVGYKQTAEQSWDQKYPPNSKTTVFWAYSATRYSGSLDYYDEQGFKGLTSWSVQIPNLGPGNSLTVAHTALSVGIL